MSVGAQCNIFERVILYSACFLFFSCAAGQQVTQDFRRHPIDMGIYTVDAPLGEGWTVNIDEENKHVIFMNQQSLFSGEGLPKTMIHVFRNWVLQEMYELSEEEVAEDYRNREIMNMERMGVDPGKYELHDVKKGTSTMDGRKLYSLSYMQMGGEWFGASKVGEAALYLYFPSDFTEKHIFYLFHISEIHERDPAIKADLTQIDPVINSFRLK